MHRPWVVLAASLALAGCGGDDDGKGRTVTVPEGAAVHMTAREYAFDPKTITVEKAGEVRITLGNEGSLAHDLRIRREDREIGGTPVFRDGRRTVRVRLARGRYRFLCTVGDHAKLGMVGTLRVR
jgi:plastocyanin